MARGSTATKTEQRDLVECIVAELRKRRDLVALFQPSGQIIVHVNRQNQDQPVKLEYHFQA